jgi:hypothetical protein
MLYCLTHHVLSCCTLHALTPLDLHLSLPFMRAAGDHESEAFAELERMSSILRQLEDKDRV